MGQFSDCQYGIERIDSNGKRQGEGLCYSLEVACRMADGLFSAGVPVYVVDRFSGQKVYTPDFDSDWSTMVEGLS